LTAIIDASAEHALATDKRVFLVAQHDAVIDDPQPADIYTMGCVANIVQSLKLPDGNIMPSRGVNARGPSGRKTGSSASRSR
jgi:ATP-dependent Lon protease